MPTALVCPWCGLVLRGNDEHAAGQLLCPQCSAPLAAPSPDEGIRSPLSLASQLPSFQARHLCQLRQWSAALSVLGLLVTGAVTFVYFLVVGSARQAVAARRRAT